MNQILEDPSDDTKVNFFILFRQFEKIIFKGFFDPNTGENLSYLQLLDRAVHDPATDLQFLLLTPDGNAMKNRSFRR